MDSFPPPAGKLPDVELVGPESLDCSTLLADNQPFESGTAVASDDKSHQAWLLTQPRGLGCADFATVGLCVTTLICYTTPLFCKDRKTFTTIHSLCLASVLFPLPAGPVADTLIFSPLLILESILSYTILKPLTYDTTACQIWLNKSSILIDRFAMFVTKCARQTNFYFEGGFVVLLRQCLDCRFYS